VKVPTKYRIKKSASLVRAYINSYHQLEQCAGATSECNSRVADVPTAGTTIKQELLYSEIERLTKAFKGHRCALDFDRGFVNSQFTEVVKTTNDNEMLWSFFIKIVE
jgi:hypothetical protein